MNGITKKPLWLMAIVLLLAGSVALAGCGAKNGGGGSADASGGDKPAVKLKIADILTNPVFRVAKSKGFFAEHGIDAELVTFATPAEGINSLFIKQTDIGYGAEFPILNAVSKGGFSIIASTGTATDAAAAQWKLFVRDDIRKPEDLAGKKLSNFRGTFVSYLWDEYFKAHNVPLDDSDMIGQGGFDEAFVALSKGEIDAVWVVGSALVDKFAALKGVHQLTDMSQTKVRVGSDLIASNAFIDAHPDAVAGLIQAVDEASQFIKANPDETADILYKEVKQPKDATIKDLPTNNWEVGFTQASYDALAAQKTYMVGAGVIQKDFDLAGTIDLDALKKIVPDRVTYGN